MHAINCSFCDIRLANLPFIELHCYLDFARPWTTFNALEVKKINKSKKQGKFCPRTLNNISKNVHKILLVSEIF